MNIDLLPCPLCGGEAEIVITGGAKYIKRTNETVYLHAVACSNINCSVNIGYFWNRKKSAAAWNTRAEPKAMMPDWISAKDRLPNPKSKVLVAFEDGFMATVEYVDNWELWANSGEPTHWMPLTKPTKER